MHPAVIAFTPIVHAYAVESIWELTGGPSLPYKKA